MKNCIKSKKIIFVEHAFVKFVFKEKTKNSIIFVNINYLGHHFI